MNASDRMVVDSFVDEMNNWEIGDTNPPLHKTDRRMMLADMILTEISGDDLECLALRAWATAATDLCISPSDVSTIEAYVAAKRAYLEMLQAGE